MTYTDPELYLISQITKNWNATNLGGSTPIISQGELYQNQDLSNSEYVLVYNLDTTHVPFDLQYASRWSKPNVMIGVSTGTSRARLAQMVGEVYRILETPAYWTLPQFNLNIIGAPDMSKEARLWYEIDILAEMWFVEVP